MTSRGTYRPVAVGLAPALVVLALITVLPGLYLFVVSLTPLDLTRPETFADFSRPLANYTGALDDERFLNSLFIQLELSAGTVTLQLLIGLGLALLLNVRDAYLEALRTAFLIPMVLPPIVVAIVWKIIFTPDVSPLHRGLEYIGLPMPALLASADTALVAIVLAETWEWFPFTFLMTLAALQTVPSEPIEAARIDGANRRQIFRYVVLPYIQPTLVITALFRLIDSIKAFPLIYVLTGGGPGVATEVTNFYAFQQAFNYSYWGYSSAIATLLVVGTLVLSVIIGRLQRRAAVDD